MVFAVHSCLMDQEMSVSLKYRDLKPSWFFNSFLLGRLGEFMHFTFSNHRDLKSNHFFLLITFMLSFCCSCL